jgi:hypothetical protein
MLHSWYPHKIGGCYVNASQMTVIIYDSMKHFISVSFLAFMFWESCAFYMRYFENMQVIFS